MRLGGRGPALLRGILCALAACVPAAQAQDFAALVRAYRDRPVEANRAAVLRAAKTNLERLALAAVDAETGNAAPAPGSGISVSELADYAAFLRAQTYASRKEAAASIQEAEQVLAARPASPLTAQAAVLAAGQLIEMGRAQDAVNLLRPRLDRIPPAEGAWMLARALEAAGDLAGAAMQYQKVFYGFPLSKQAADAAGSLAELRARLGEIFPPVTAQTRLARADKLRESGNPKLAIEELTAALGELGTNEREVAEVRIGAARTSGGEHQEARAHLRGLALNNADADAERWYWVLVSSRRMNDDEGALAAMAELDSRHAASDWRAESLVYLANSFLVRNQPERYLPLYGACAEEFPRHPKAADCHWKVVWRRYLGERAAAQGALRLHAERFPWSEKFSAALYFLGRIAQESGSPSEARAYFEAILAASQNSYYAVLARQQMADLLRHPSSAAVQKWAAPLSAEAARADNAVDFTMDAPSRLRIRRAQLLASVGLDRWAELELRFGAETDAKPQLMAMESAALAVRRGETHQGIRSIKRLAPDYLRWSMDATPARFWKLAFPLPFRAEIEKHAESRSLDSHMVAALIRQESEFDPKVVSRANAVGLTQIRPPTGREISRPSGAGRYRSSLLTNPSSNLQMGTYYLSRMLNALGGKWEAALAAYNAGKSRAAAWLQWGEFREPAEFIETIPFSETRDYVQIVFRNADLYKRIYGKGQVAVRSSGGASQTTGRSGNR
jgi:soluble lytic murein transglycosylase